jgi:hypothetical protein
MEKTREIQSRIQFEKDNQNKSISKPNKADELEDRLETLNKLKQKGLISQDEYLEKRKKILDEL